MGSEGITNLPTMVLVHLRCYLRIHGTFYKNKFFTAKIIKKGIIKIRTLHWYLKEVVQNLLKVQKSSPYYKSYYVFYKKKGWIVG